MEQTATQGTPALAKSIAEVAQRCGRDTDTIYLWMRRGILPYVVINGRRRVRWADVERLIGEGGRVA